MLLLYLNIIELGKHSPRCSLSPALPSERPLGLHSSICRKVEFQALLVGLEQWDAPKRPQIALYST